MKFVSDWAKEFEGDGDVRRCKVGRETLEKIDKPSFSIGARPFRGEGALLRATPNHDLPAHGGAGFCEVAGIVKCPGVDRRIRVGEVVAFSFREEPVESYHFQAVVADDGSELFRLCGGDRCGVSKSEGGYFQPGITVAGGLCAGSGEVVVTEGFITNSKLHGGSETGVGCVWKGFCYRSRRRHRANQRSSSLVFLENRQCALALCFVIHAGEGIPLRQGLSVLGR